MPPEDLTAWAKPTPAATADRRVAERTAAARPMPRRVYLVEDFRRLDAWVTDLALSGLGLILPAPLPEGTLVFLELESTPEVRPVKVWATALCNRLLNDETWLVGCEFVAPLTTSELQALLR
jgi:hypothetical protein